MSGQVLSIGWNWNGTPLKAAARTEVFFERTGGGLLVRVDAPFHDDPVPAAPAGRLARLWQYEVVELFLVGPDGHYIELEFGPHGHWLALAFSAPRVLARDDLSIDFRISDQATNARWIAEGWIADGPSRQPIVSANAFAIHGSGKKRFYETAFSLPGEEPDFHQPKLFPLLES